MYKFINEYNIEKYEKKYVYVDNIQISYPSPEVLLMAGIKPLKVEECPVYDEITQFAESYYEDGETEITQKWRIIDIQGVIDDGSLANS